jgi:M6 family metalloprotease-like protein
VGINLLKKWLLTSVLLFSVLNGTTVFGESISDSDKLHDLRLSRHSHPVSSFSLLVIPVEFSDNHFNNSYQQHISNILFAEDGITLQNYFNSASRGRCNLNITLSPLVQLSGTMDSYSDGIGSGFQLIRHLADQAISTAVVNGVHLGLFDNDGPDCIPDSGDDDAEVDGILILHSGPAYQGEELPIFPQNYFLETPIISNGISARFFSIASAFDILGVIAHETAHLFGLEDRYDVPRGGNVGGLGHYSLMASGYQQDDLALFDPYSAAQLGWVDIIDIETPFQGEMQLLAGEVVRFNPPRYNNPDGEYFLAEVRPQDILFDMHLPSDQMIIYHIDESIPDDHHSSSNPLNRHLRVSVVEADSDNELHFGNDSGSASDLFPGSNEVVEFSYPSSSWYSVPSTLVLSNIQSQSNGVTFNYSAETSVEIIIPEDESFNLSINSFGRILESTIISLEVSDNQSGSFNNGELIFSSSLEQNPSTKFWNLVDIPQWVVNDPQQAIQLSVSFSNGITSLVDQFILHYPIIDNPFDFDGNWEDRWSISSENIGDTVWQRWENCSNITRDGSTVLACTDDYTSSTWPDISYSNNSITKLTTTSFAQPGTKIAMIHYFDTIVIPNNPTSDFAEISLISNSNATIPLLMFSGSGEFEYTGFPLWRLSVFTVPNDGAHRIEFSFESDSEWRSRGWLIHSVELVESHFPNFDPYFDIDNNLCWEFGFNSIQYNIDYSIDAVNWATIATSENSTLDNSQLPVSPLRFSRDYFRIRAETDFGTVVSTSISRIGSSFTSSSTNIMSATQNSSGINLLLDLPPYSGNYKLELFDIRGRLVNSWNFQPGNFFHQWDGEDSSQQQVSAGCYFFLLTGNELSESTKVTWVK